MKKIILISTMILFVFGSIANAETLRITACGHHDYPPINWKKGDEIVGIAAEITKTLFGKAGLEVDMSYKGPWARCLHNIKKGSVDVNICNLINEERKTYSEYIMTPMGFTEYAVFVKKGKEFPFEKWEDLKGKAAGEVLGVTQGQKLDDFLKANTKIERVASYLQNFKKLALGRLDFFIMVRQSGLAMRDSFGLNDEIVDLPHPVMKKELYISMSKKSPYLYILPKVEKMIQEEGYYDWVDSLWKKYTKEYEESK